MDMPKPTQEHHRLARLAGRWVGEETLHPSPWDPKGGKAKGRMRARMALGGFHLIMDYEQERDGRMTFEGHGVLGWDPRGKCYALHWFDSSGIEHGAPSLGSWEGPTLSVQHETTDAGHSRQVYEIDEDEYRFKLQHSADGREWKTFLEGNYRRLG
jgi:hypothetical protein